MSWRPPGSFRSCGAARVRKAEGLDSQITGHGKIPGCGQQETVRDLTDFFRDGNEEIRWKKRWNGSERTGEEDHDRTVSGRL